MASNSRAACCRLEFMDERKSHIKMRYYLVSRVDFSGEWVGWR